MPGYTGSNFNFPFPRQTFGFTFLFLGWTCRGRAVLWCLLPGLLLESVFVLIIIVFVVICVWIYTDGNMLMTRQFAWLSVDLCGSGHTFLLFWNTFDFLFWLLLFSLFCVFFFCLLFLHLLSICYNGGESVIRSELLEKRMISLKQPHFGRHHSPPLKYLDFSWSLSFWAWFLFHSCHLLHRLFPLSSFLASAQNKYKTIRAVAQNKFIERIISVNSPFRSNMNQEDKMQKKKGRCRKSLLLINQNYCSLEKGFFCHFCVM